MSRVLISAPIGQDPDQKSRMEDRLCRILLFAPAGAYLFRSDRRMGVAVDDSTKASAPKVCLWDEVR